MNRTHDPRRQVTGKVLFGRAARSVLCLLAPATLPALALAPLPVKGVPAKPAGTLERSLFTEQVLPKVQAFLKQQGESCPYEGRPEDIQAVPGAFTRKGAAQTLIAVDYCSSPSALGWSVLAVTEGNNLVKVTTVKLGNASVERAPDFNGDGTNEVLVRSGGSGAGAMFDTVSLLDLAGSSIKDFGTYQQTYQTCMWAQPGDQKAGDDTMTLFVRPGPAPTVIQDVRRQLCSSGKTVTVQRQAKAKSLGSFSRQIYWANAAPAPTPLLGRSTPVEGSALCPKATCVKLGSASLDAQTEFAIYGSPDSGWIRRLFVFRVGNVNRMLGYYGYSAGSIDVYDPLQLSPTLVGGLVRAAAGDGAVQPALKGIRVRGPEDEGTFEQARDLTLTLPGNRVISNVTAVRNGPSGPQAQDALAVTYVADQQTLARLRGIINGKAPQAAQALAAAYQAAVKGLGAKTPCGGTPGVQVAVGGTEASWKKVYTYFDSQAMVSTGGVFGEPLQLHLPGLSLTSLTIEVPQPGDDPGPSCLLKPAGRP